MAEIISNRHLIHPFIVHKYWCIVVPSSPHGIRIFYQMHVYDVLLTDKELKDWVRCGTEWQRTFIRKLLDERLLETEGAERNSSIEDGYLA